MINENKYTGGSAIDNFVELTLWHDTAGTVVYRVYPESGKIESAGPILHDPDYIRKIARDLRDNSSRYKVDIVENLNQEPEIDSRKPWLLLEDRGSWREIARLFFMGMEYTEISSKLRFKNPDSVNTRIYEMRKWIKAELGEEWIDKILPMRKRGGKNKLR